jgi:type I site-specific restriction endonuclease
MQELNFPSYSFRLKTSENKTLIFDIVRKKYFVLTPEEWVRQHVIHFLHFEKKYPLSLMAIEKQVKVNSLNQRTDIVVYNTSGKPFLIVECKAPSIEISQQTFDQIARYNMTLEADLLLVTNGIQHIYAVMDHDNKSYVFLKELPKYFSDQ